MLVLAQQQRLMRNRQIDEPLVVGVAAGQAGFGVERQLRDCKLRRQFDIAYLRCA